MALTIRRDAAETAPEAVVLSESMAGLYGLSDDLDVQFGHANWATRAADAPLDDLLGEDGPRSFVIVPLAGDDRDGVEAAFYAVRAARNAGLMVLLVVGDVSTRTMHALLKEGVTDFAPYPEPRGALNEAIERLRLARASGRQGLTTIASAKPTRLGRITAVYGVAGGVGTSTVAVNLAWEIVNLVRKEGRRVVLLDLNFQFGSVATLLDVPRREAVYELITDARNFDQTGLQQALSTYKERLHVLTAPRDSLPLDVVGPEDVEWILRLARESFDYVVIDMPQTLMSWSETVYTASDHFFCMMETDMRSAQNAFRFLRTLKSESMQLDKLRFVVNRAPGMTDLSGKARVKRLAESLAVTFTGFVPDGGRTIAGAGDQGVPLSESARSNPVRKEIFKLAKSIVDAEQQAAERRG